MSETQPDSDGVDQFIIYGAYGEIMHKFQVLELVLWGFLARGLKGGITLDQGMARVERWDATTFGQMWRGLRTQDHWPNEVIAECDQAVMARNYLAHHFLREYFFVTPPQPHREGAGMQLARIATKLDSLLAQLDQHGREMGLPDVDDLDEQTRQEIEAMRPTTWFTAG